MAPAAIALPPRMTGNFVFAIDTSDMEHKFCFLPDCDVGQQNQPLLPTPVSALSVATAGKLVYVTHAQSAVVTTYSVDATNGALTFIGSFPAGSGATSARIFLGTFLYLANSGDGSRLRLASMAKREC
jgi:6-phosphogluconolactonase (cycloisomerase 2 family)